MRRTIVAVAFTALALTGCDDPDTDEAPPAPTTGAFTPPPPDTAMPSPEGLPTDPSTGSAAPAPDQPGPESVVPTPSEQLAGP